MKQERDIKAKIKNINKIHLLSEGGFFVAIKIQIIFIKIGIKYLTQGINYDKINN